MQLFLPVEAEISVTKVRTDGQKDGRTNGRINGRTDRRTRWLQYSPLSMRGSIIYIHGLIWKNKSEKLTVKLSLKNENDTHSWIWNNNYLITYENSGGKKGDNIKDRYTKIYKINKLLHTNKEYNHRTSFHTVTCIISNLAQSQYTCAALAREIMIPASVKEPKSIYPSLI